ncbi:hypothetical protein ABG067_005157 [Albugo candida]
MYVAKPKQHARAKKHDPPSKTKAKSGPSIIECASKRDFTGMIAILEFQLKSEDVLSRKSSPNDTPTDTAIHSEWLAYAYFHLGNYQQALDWYHRLPQTYDCPNLSLYRACCLYFLQQYKQAIKEAVQGPVGPLQNRILFHCAHKLSDEDKLLVYHQQLTDVKEDQLSLAAMHFFRNHYQEATDIYKRLLLENRDDLALNVYVAMCYYKLDYYDVSLEIMQAYLQAFPDSVVAINVKACNQFKLYNGAAAKDEIQSLTDKGYNIESNDLVSHNMVVFDDGAHALRILPQLVDSLPEARMNLVIYHLKQGNVKDAYDLIKDLEPSTPQEYILKGVVFATLGQMRSSRQQIKTAQQYFQLVGSSPTECDTIPGRQCMASCFYLLQQFDDVNIYLNSIKQYMYNEDEFNWNFGISLCHTGSYQEALDTLLRVQGEAYRQEYGYISWLCRCYILNHTPSAAWALYLKLENADDSFNIVQLIAQDCYKIGEFLYAAKAFQVLERLDPDPEYWEGKRGACVGIFQRVVAGKAGKTDLEEALTILKSNNNPQVEYIVRIMKKWGAENGMLF